ncbi:hypothetical protein [Candidatus Solirubrobacter pratensis]|uniref:hypothetical protein n=1 Tax=Candidatus Solirubrobacter pratensis TaxID=1298857 RepID=UPI00055F0A91|nr:hypothetical protein [Candidatus Solirubrobacter pratensis]
MTDALTLPEWYDPQNFSDAGLMRTISGVADLDIEFEYDPGDRSVGLADGFTSVAFSLTGTGLFDVHIAFEYQQGEGGNHDVVLGLWTLCSVMVKMFGGDMPLTWSMEPRPYLLADFPVLLKMAQDKWADMERVEREQAEAEAALFEQHEQEEREAHEQGKHNDGYDHPDCTLCP